MNFFKLFHPCSFLFVITSVISSSTYGGACEHIISISPKFSNLDLAIEHNLTGVHLPENTIINKYMTSEKSMIYGRSLHESSQDLNPNNIFDYFHIGPVFPTLTHPGKKTLTKEKIVNLTKNLDNIIFVGGINIKNVHKLSNYNFNGIAVMRELLLSKNPSHTFLNLEEIMNE